MAQHGPQSDQEKHCLMCFDPLEDPVFAPCGHRYCMSCIKNLCDEESTHSCPQCREETIAAPGPADEPQESLHEETSTPDTLQPDEEEPKTRAEFLKYSCELTLDPNTVNTHLMLSEGNRKATNMEEDQAYPSHPDRFVDGCLVLSKESLTGRHYWEVERSGAVSVAVSYKDISRTGTESSFGLNDKSWALDCFNSRYIVRHMYIHAAKPLPVSSRVGVYLDHGAGILSFYSVSETMTLLYRYQTTFTQPLYAGFWVHGHKSSAMLCYEASCGVC